MQTTKRGVPGSVLKWVAILTMFVDHAAASLVYGLAKYSHAWGTGLLSKGGYWFLRGVGRHMVVGVGEKARLLAGVLAVEAGGLRFDLGVQAQTAQRQRGRTGDGAFQEISAGNIHAAFLLLESCISGIGFLPVLSFYPLLPVLSRRELSNLRHYSKTMNNRTLDTSLYRALLRGRIPGGRAGRYGSDNGGVTIEDGSRQA